MPKKGLIQSRFPAWAGHVRDGKLFLVIGIANVIFTYSVYQIANIYVHYTTAFLISFVSGILFSAVLNSRFTFSVRLSVKSFLLFSVVCIVNYFIGLQLLKFLVELVGLHEAVAPLVVIAAMVPISFVGTRLALTGSIVRKGRGTPARGRAARDQDASPV